ncbi:Zinc finger, RING-type [Corchorus capsularis]|uniref:RING-type E3 ubiquitin transferase n=1 Tax=Corchorus capsularis TaxID=210143 RepID=A0A1R3GEZ3_COCAP|nr:Zinc finger, RING-type [Corchorus capsularis]
MQGQGSSSNSLTGNLYFNGNPAANQQNVVPNINASSTHNGQGQNSSMRSWIGESSSSRDHTRNHVSNSHQFSGDDLWLSSLSNQSGNGQRFEERHFLDNIGRINQIGPSNLVGQASSGANNNLHRNIDLNAAHDDHHGGGIIDHASQDNGPQLSLGLSRAAGDQVPVSGGGSSSASASASASAPVMIYSGIAEYVVEENIGAEGTLASDGRRRLLCKRRAPENEIPRRQVTFGESSRPISSVQQPAAAIPSSLNAANYSLSNRLHGSNNSSSGFVSAQAPTLSSFQQINQNGTGQMDNFERNIRMRRTLMGTQQNTTPTNMWSWNSTNSNVQVQTQITSFARFPNTNSAAAPAMAQPMTHNFSSLQPSHSQWNNNGTAMTSSWAGLSDNLREALIQEQSLRDYYRRNSNHHLTNMQDQHLNSFANGNYTNYNFGNNIASSSRSTQLPPPSVRNQLVQRLQHLVNEGISHCPIHSGSASSSAARDMDVSVRGGNARPAQRLAGTRADQRHSENPSQTAAAQRRSRLVAEVRNALGLVRRGGAFRLEDVMVIDRSFLYGLPELGDTHDAMRLDVDNMSYEELLDLEEQIGNVSTGLTDEAILANLRRRKYQSITDEPTAETEPCCICQEDYANGEELGKLDCGHDFHFNCIKQWLVQKNSCPICKKTALAL